MSNIKNFLQESLKIDRKKEDNRKAITQNAPSELARGGNLLDNVLRKLPLFAI